jgi:predicted transposase YbfD/YdcC
MEIPKAMRISRQILTDQKQLENMEYINYLGSMITNDAICTQKIKTRIAMARTEFNKTILFTSKRDLKLKK